MSGEASQLPVRWISELLDASLRERGASLGRGKKVATAQVTAYASELLRIITGQANTYCEAASASRSSVRRLRQDQVLKALYALGFRRYYNRLKAMRKATDNDDHDEAKSELATISSVGPHTAKIEPISSSSSPVPTGSSTSSEKTAIAGPRRGRKRAAKNIDAEKNVGMDLVTSKGGVNAPSGARAIRKQRKGGKKRPKLTKEEEEALAREQELMLQSSAARLQNF